jgi:hypothetical protein
MTRQKAYIVSAWFVSSEFGDERLVENLEGGIRRWGVRKLEEALRP